MNNANGNNKAASKFQRFGEGNVVDNTKAARLFHQTYGCYPTSIFEKMPDGTARNTQPYLYWTDHNRTPVYDASDDSLLTGYVDKAAWLRNVITAEDTSSFDSYRFSEYPVGYSDEAAYLNDKNAIEVLHPTAMEWYFVGMASMETDIHVPSIIPITKPSNRVRLYNIFKRTRSLPRLTEFNPMGKAFKSGVFQPLRGFLLMEGLYEGSVANPKLASKFKL